MPSAALRSRSPRWACSAARSARASSPWPRSCVATRRRWMPPTQRLLHFVSCAPWDDRAVRSVAAKYAIEAMTECEPVEAWILDDTGFRKQGSYSAGVQCQYTGSAGKIANSQIGVSLSIATRTEHVPVDFELYLPERWSSVAPHRVARRREGTCQLLPLHPARAHRQARSHPYRHAAMAYGRAYGDLKGEVAFTYGNAQGRAIHEPRCISSALRVSGARATWPVSRTAWVMSPPTLPS